MDPSEFARLALGVTGCLCCSILLVATWLYWRGRP